MNIKSIVVLAAFATASAALAQDKPAPAPAPEAKPAQAAPAAAALEYCVFHTNKGDIFIELDRAKAPVTVENFVGYIKDGFYDGTVFHRIVPNFVIQGGGFDTQGVQKKNKAPISNEWQNGLKNKRGTLSMARTAAPNSATSQFFISLKDNDMLDQPISGGAGYAVYGRVISGMDIVDEIAKAKRTVKKGMQDWPIEDIVVSKAEMISKADADKAAAQKPAAAAPQSPATPAVPAAPATPAAPAGRPTSTPKPAKPE
jgi:cyclophilin family peptidyl-prolyl cis-trans isomerase